MGSSTREKAAALLEVAGVLACGLLVARGLAGALGLSRSRALLERLPDGAAPDFIGLAATSAGELSIRWGIPLLLAFAIGWWHRRRRLDAYGLTRAGRRTGRLVAIGVLLWATAFLPALALRLLAEHLPLGAGPPHWRSLQAVDWNAGFWLFMAVSSFGLVPPLEELFMRGYAQTRLAEDLGAGSAIVVVSVLFALAHTQYLRPEALGLGTLLGLVWGSLVLGFALHRTGSLLPCVVAHALGNLPLTAGFRAAAVMLMVAALVGWRRPIAVWARDLRGELAAVPTWRPVLVAVPTIAAAVGAILLSRWLIVPWATAALLLALHLERTDRTA